MCFGCQARVGCVFSGLCPLGLGPGLRSCRLHVPDSLCGCGSLAKSCLTLFVFPWIVARQVPLSSTISQRLLKFMSVELVILSNHLILCPPLLPGRKGCRNARPTPFHSHSIHSACPRCCVGDLRAKPNMAYLTQLIIWSERQMNQVTYTHLIAKYNMNFIEGKQSCSENL